ncbi:hypothetical protein [Rhizomonospora bruguierae]|uniref:hypothetical protein n=1 Tax=Rhizomonospora bruguierae TaxID=1581705 RepID=UPI001BCDE07D|nr:hypothetical protein [Micromonospora sp. NBRC 107566]
MPRLTRMPPEPPDRYVVFVRQHLEPLRSAAAGIVGADHHADELYPEVLTAVAARWGWLELLRTRLGRCDAADSYLGEAFARESQRWRRGQVGDDGRETLPMVVLRPGAPPPPLPRPFADPEGLAAPPAARRRSSAATRIAPFLRADSRSTVTPLAEAALAWFHAYETRRRRRLTAVVIGLVLLVLLLLRLAHYPDALALARR